MTFVLKIRDCNSKRVLKIFATPKGFVFQVEHSEFQLPKRNIASDFKACFWCCENAKYECHFSYVNLALKFAFVVLACFWHLLNELSIWIQLSSQKQRCPLTSTTSKLFPTKFSILGLKPVAAGYISENATTVLCRPLTIMPYENERVGPLWDQRSLNYFPVRTFLSQSNVFIW